MQVSRYHNRLDDVMKSLLQFTCKNDPSTIQTALKVAQVSGPLLAASAVGALLIGTALAAVIVLQVATLTAFTVSILIQRHLIQNLSTKKDIDRNAKNNKISFAKEKEMVQLQADLKLAQIVLAKDKEIGQLQTSLKLAQNAKGSAQESLDAIKIKLSEGTNQIQNLNQQLEAVRSSSKAIEQKHTSQLVEMENNRKALTEELAQLHLANENLKEEKNKLEQTITSLNIQIGKLQQPSSVKVIGKSSVVTTASKVKENGKKIDKISIPSISSKTLVSLKKTPLSPKTYSALLKLDAMASQEELVSDLLALTKPLKSLEVFKEIPYEKGKKPLIYFDTSTINFKPESSFDDLVNFFKGSGYEIKIIDTSLEKISKILSAISFKTSCLSDIGFSDDPFVDGMVLTFGKAVTALSMVQCRYTESDKLQRHFKAVKESFDKTRDQIERLKPIPDIKNDDLITSDSTPQKLPSDEESQAEKSKENQTSPHIKTINSSYPAAANPSFVPPPPPQNSLKVPPPPPPPAPNGLKGAPPATTTGGIKQIAAEDRKKKQIDDLTTKLNEAKIRLTDLVEKSRSALGQHKNLKEKQSGYDRSLVTAIRTYQASMRLLKEQEADFEKDLQAKKDIDTCLAQLKDAVGKTEIVTFNENDFQNDEEKKKLKDDLNSVLPDLQKQIENQKVNIKKAKETLEKSRYNQAFGDLEKPQEEYSQLGKTIDELDYIVRNKLGPEIDDMKATIKKHEADLEKLQKPADNSTKTNTATKKPAAGVDKSAMLAELAKKGRNKQNVGREFLSRRGVTLEDVTPNKQSDE